MGIPWQAKILLGSHAQNWNGLDLVKRMQVLCSMEVDRDEKSSDLQWNLLALLGT